MLKEIDVVSVPQNNQTNGLTSRLSSLIASQRRNLQNLSVLVFVNFLTAGIGFITSVKIANTIGKETFGLLAYGFAIAAYGSVIIRFGLDRTLVRDLIHYPERFGELVAASLLLRWILFGVVLIGLLSWKIAAGAGSDISWGLLLVIIANSMMAMDLQPVYDSWQKMSRHAVYNLIQRCLYFVVIWVTILIAPQKLSIFWIGAATLVSVVLYLIMQHNWAIPQIDMTTVTVPLFSAAIRMARDNITILLATIAGLSFGSLNQLVLKHYRGTAELGGYAAGWQIISIAMIFLTQIARIGNPATARITKPGISKRDKIKLLIKYSSVMCLAVCPVCLATIVWPEFILRLIYSPEYASGAGVLRIMGFYLSVFSISAIASQYLVSSRQEILYFRNVMIGGLVSVAFSFILIPKLGAMGAILSLLFAHSLLIMMNWIVIFKHLMKVSSL